MAYPKEIKDLLIRDLRVRSARPHIGTGVGANLECGCTARFFIAATEENGGTPDLHFGSNGCGFMVAAASILADTFNGSDVRDLHGLAPEELRGIIAAAFRNTPQSRFECVEAVIEAFRSAYSDLRKRRVEEFKGEGAIVCTCFGVSEERIEAEIKQRNLMSVEEVGTACRAGTGCGSCTMLIREMLDDRRHDEQLRKS